MCAPTRGPALHRRVGSLPRLADYVRSSVNPSSYVETPARAAAPEVWLRHSDAVSCLSLDEGAGLLYSASWDGSFKVWRVSDSRCLESVCAHDDAINTVAAAGFDGVVFTGSADGTVKVWRREEEPAASGGEAKTRHVLETVLREDESAVTAIAVSAEGRVVYVGSSDGDVTYWHWIDGEARYGGALRAHGTAVMCLAVAGNVVVSGSADRTLCAWRRGGGEHSRLAVLAGTPAPSVRGRGRGGDIIVQLRRRAAVRGVQRQPRRVSQGVANLRHRTYQSSAAAAVAACMEERGSAGGGDGGGGEGVVAVPDVGDEQRGSGVTARLELITNLTQTCVHARTVWGSHVYCSRRV